MKKLSIIFVLLAVFCFLTAGSAVAGQPNCGVWMLSPGTSSTTLDNYYQNIPGVPSIATTPCSFLSWKLVTQPTSCRQRTTLRPWWVVDVAPPGTTTCKQPSLAVVSVIDEVNPGNIGTFSFADIRVPAQPIVWYGKILRASAVETQYWLPGWYTSSQTSSCSPDLAATYGPWYFMWPQVHLFSWNVMEAEIISGKQGATIIYPTEYTTVELEYSVKSKVLGGAVSVLPSGNIKLEDMVDSMVVEIKKPLRGDLNRSGVVTVTDFNIFVANWLKTALCGCGNYWQ